MRPNWQRGGIRAVVVLAGVGLVGILGCGWAGPSCVATEHGTMLRNAPNRLLPLTEPASSRSILSSCAGCCRTGRARC